MVDFITNELLVGAILVLLAVSTLISVLDILGFLPAWARNWIHKNRATDTIRTLQALGVDVPGLRRREVANHIPAFYSGSDIKSRSLSIAQEFYIKGKKLVGSVNAVNSPGFVDIMSASTDHRHAEMIAKLLAAFWREQVAKPGEVVSLNVDFVVAPKSGSPTIAYEFSRLVKIPLVLHNAGKKFESGKNESAAVFDASFILKPGMVGLILDDSTTGGAKMLSLINDLHKHDLITTDALVFFEPQLKKPRITLEAKGIKLHSILFFSAEGKLV
ncbi:hypothetical protein [Mesorhizobium sp. J428]|uniref:hypothetical protein n=1 Tax=Mesorhizobium sp. J428 TaxID=2898440 RepID=UPI0021510A8A|nr:hypothetical protein [Mesorhizobium sp. J428]MCR5857565.1 hypothetical protein [Mesorhizobium sp. J428]